MGGDPFNRSPELLAPGGSPESVRAALAAGADAIYAGARDWSRGGPLLGLSPEEISTASGECAEAGAALHVAFNIVPGAAEIPAFLGAIRRARDSGVAHVILSDPGAISLVGREMPDLSICASVGVSALNPPDAVFYRDLGAKAIVLPTAVSRGEVAAIKAAAGLRIEVFVRCRAEYILHGKCGLSGYAREAGGIEGRPDLASAGPASSAKRGGRCFLVCAALPVDRTPYSIEEELADWIRAGVDVFKIEGRDLPPEKLAALVSRLRAKLDHAIASVNA